MMMVSLNIFSAPFMVNEKDSIPVAGRFTAVPEEVQIKMARLEEIKAIEKTSLSRSEKKALRKEAKALKASIKKSNGTNIYYVVGAVIIILIVLIPLIGN